MKKLTQWLLLSCFAICISIYSYGQNTPQPKFISLFDGKTLNGWTAVPKREWTVTDSAIAMTGSDRGFIYTNTRYSYYRIIFKVRQIKGVDHWPCMLIFGPDPKLDAMGAVQFQLPKDYTWDYRPGRNNDGKPFFSFIGQIPSVSKTEWAQCELLVNAATGSARTAVSQPLGSPAIEITDFKDTSIKNIPTPFGFQSHNKGQFDEFKDIVIEDNPVVNDLLTVLAAPKNFEAVPKSGTRIDIQWAANPGVQDGFKIERSTDNLNWTTVAKVAANRTNYTINHLKPKRQYYFRVSAYNSVAVSPYSTVTSLTR